MEQNTRYPMLNNNGINKIKNQFPIDVKTAAHYPVPSRRTPQNYLSYNGISPSYIGIPAYLHIHATT